MPVKIEIPDDMSYEERKKKLEEAGAEFRKQRNAIIQEAVDNNGSVSLWEIDQIRPRTPRGGYGICCCCDCHSMAYGGKTPSGGCSGGDSYYLCEICGHEKCSSCQDSYGLRPYYVRGIKNRVWAGVDRSIRIPFDNTEKQASA